MASEKELLQFFKIFFADVVRNKIELWPNLSESVRSYLINYNRNQSCINVAGP